jgi:hypothetical protein
MNDRYDGSSIDLERALVRYMVERKISRRYLLDRIARFGAAAALAPVVAACTGSAASPSAAATASLGLANTTKKASPSPRISLPRCLLNASRRIGRFSLFKSAMERIAVFVPIRLRLFLM